MRRNAIPIIPSFHHSIFHGMPLNKHIKLLAGMLAVTATGAVGSEAVIVLHGLCRTDRSMNRMASALEAAGYFVLNVNYPSRTTALQDLAENVISAALADTAIKNASKVHFVTHSLGGILVRQYLKSNSIEHLGRVVMLGPPNQGSEVVDKLGDLALFEAIHGPSGKQLGTASDSIPNKLGAVNFELGIIAGDRSINWINSLTMIDGPDDGKVSVRRTKVAGMADHIVIHATHPFLMRNKQAIRETIHFLATGRFYQPKGGRTLHRILMPPEENQTPKHASKPTSGGAPQKSILLMFLAVI